MEIPFINQKSARLIIESDIQCLFYEDRVLSVASHVSITGAECLWYRRLVSVLVTHFTLVIGLQVNLLCSGTAAPFSPPVTVRCSVSCVVAQVTYRVIQVSDGQLEGQTDGAAAVSLVAGFPATTQTVTQVEH